MSRISVVAVLPDGSEYFEDVFPQLANTGLTSKDYKEVAEKAVKKAGITTPRANPQTVKVKVYRLEIVKGKLERKSFQTFHIQPPLERMTAEEYRVEMDVNSSKIPKEFGSYVESESYGRGHSSGYEECISIASDMVSALKPLINRYTKRING